MNYIDIVLGGLILFGLIRGFMKGLFIEVASLVALILGIYGAINFSYFIGDYIQDSVNWDKKYISLTAFALTFVLIIIVVSLLGKLLTKLANMVALGILNRMLGALFGALKIAVILGAIIVFIDRPNKTFEVIDPITITSSIIYQPVKELGSFIFNWVLREV